MAVSLRHVVAVLLCVFLGASVAYGQATPQLIEINPGTAASSPGPFVVLNNVVYFPATDPVNGRELWRSDGTLGGTYVVADINPGTASSSPAYLVATQTRLFFSAINNVSGQELWTSDGTAAGTHLVIDAMPGVAAAIPRNITPFNDDVFLSYCQTASGCELWKSNGTAAGTVLVKDILPGSTSSFPDYLKVLGNIVLFAANDGTNGEELWKSDGTSAGTVMVKNINPLPLQGPQSGVGRSYPTALVVAGPRVYFRADDGTHGDELWRTDGTSAGTVMVRDLSPGSDDGLGMLGGGEPLSAFDNQVFFFGRTSSASQYLLYVSDGTSAGTVSGGPGNHIYRTKFNGLFYFAYAYNEPWKGDLTFAGSSQLKDIAPGESWADSRNYSTVGNAFYFSANNQVNGAELWRSDGTEAGTVMVGDLNPGAASSSPSAVIKAGDYLLFSATTAANGLELWSIVLNRAPVADAGADQMVAEGEPVTLDGSNSSDPDGDDLTYDWRSVTGGPSLGDEATITVTLPAGIHYLQVSVSDGEYTTIDAVVVRVGNESPTAVAGGPQTAVRNVAIGFNGSGSSDPENDPLTYFWNFGDGSTGTGVSPSHAYQALGTYTVTLTVNDGFVNSAPSPTTVTITNQAPVAFAAGPYNGVRNAAITFNGSGSVDADGDALTYNWSFGDGSTGTGVAPAHAYLTLGTFAVALTVHDGTDSSAPATTSVTINNQAPAANAGGPYVSVRGTPITFNGGGSSDPDNDALTYAWDFGDGSSGTGVSPSHAYSALGTFTVALTVHDGTDSSTPTTVGVTINNQPPTASVGGPYSGVRNAAIAFDGSASSDPDNDALTYNWDFGDGATGSGVAPSHAYAALGTFTVTLTVHDGTDTSAPMTASVTIANQAPIASAGGPYSGARNTAVAFNGGGSSDPDGDALTYEWDFGDGSTGTGIAPTHAYATLATFTVTLTVNDGATTSPAASGSVTIANQSPTADADGPYAGVRNTPITFNGGGSNDPDNDALTYAWDFGDGSTGEGVSPTHAYQTVGTFTVTLTVNDGITGSAPVTASVTIANQAPGASAGGPYSSVRNTAIAFNGGDSSDPDGDELTYDWDFGDGATGSGASPTHAYATLGTFTVTLTVNDGTENSAPVTASVTVTNQTPTANAGGPYSDVRNTAITFNGADSSDPDGDALACAWDFGDGSTGTGASPTHAYVSMGTFTVTLTVNDGTDDSTPATALVTISNQAPSASAGGPYSGVRNTAIAFNGGGSSDPDGDGLSYAWDFGDSSTGTGASPAHAYTALGTFTVSLTVNDGTENSAPVTANVTITNQAPTASPGGPYSGVRNAAIAFNGSGSGDPDNDALTYAWDFGDGTTGTGVAPTHAYTTLGTFVVSLTVNDGTTTSPAATDSVTITNQAPVAQGAGPYAGTRLGAISFSGSASSDPDGDALTYAWNFGDGSTGSGVAPSHLYVTVGTFAVTLTVADGNTTSAPYTTSVTITNVPPSVALTSPPDGAVFGVGAPIAIAAAAIDSDGGVAKVEFYAGAAKIGEALSPPYSMSWSGAAAGTYAITARVTDTSDAVVTSAPRSIVVNALPTVAITSPAHNAQFAAPASITITASAGDVDGTVTQVEFFRGSTSLGVDNNSPYSVVWNGAAAGSYDITAVATDNQGATTISAPITVKVTASLSPTADAYVRASNGNSNFGNATTLTVQQGNSNGNIRWSYLKFDLSGVPTITNVRLQLFGSVSGTTGTPIQTAVYAVSNTTWTETGLTWNNRPASDASALASVAIVTSTTTDQWYELDVTSYLQAEKAAGRNVVTLVLKDLANSSPYVEFVSKEGAAANRPRILVVP